MIPKPITECGEKKWCRFAAHAGEREQNPGDNPLGRGFHHDVNDRFPPADAERERGLAITIRHQEDDFFRRAQD